MGIFAKPYNKKSVENLNKPIVLSPPRQILAIIGVLLAIVAILLWAFFGTMQSTVKLDGAYVSTSTSNKLATKVTGIVTGVNFRKGDRVSAGDVIVNLDDSQIKEQKSRMQTYLDNSQSMTWESRDDKLNTYNQTLADIKTRAQDLPSNLDANREKLEDKQKEQTDQQSLVSTAESKMKSAQDAFYDSLQGGSTDNLYFDYQIAQSKYTSLSNAYNSALALYEDCQERYDKANKELTDLKSKLTAAKDEEDIQDLKLQVSTKQAEVSMLKDYTSDNKTAMQKAKNEMDDAQTAYNTAKSRYNSAGGTSSSSAKASAYTSASNDYNEAYSKLLSIKEGIEMLKVQIELEESSIEIETKALKKQFEENKSTIVKQINDELALLNEQLANTQVKTDKSGIITDLAVQKASVVTSGDEVAKVSPDNDGANIIVSYVKKGMKLEPGMKVMVFPKTNRKEDVGYMSATVKEVSEAVATDLEIKDRLDNKELIGLFVGSGPVKEVTFELQQDKNSQNGYKWSSPKGRFVKIEQGTQVEMQVILQKAPAVNILFPNIFK